MYLDPSDRYYKDLYKLLAGLVVPRPIALVTTTNDDDSVNVAPYSFFNILVEKPPMVAFGAGIRPDGQKKDTIRNIDNNREFVINLMGHEHLQHLHTASISFPPNESELSVAGLSVTPSRKVRTPRLTEARVSMECHVRNSMMVSKECYIIVGEIVYMYIDKRIIDEETDYIDLDKYDPVGRLYGGRYIRVKTADIDQLDNPDLAHK